MGAPVAKPFDGSDVSFIFTTIARNACAMRLIASARATYPELSILVADQNPRSEEMEAFYRRYGAEVHWTPFDFGVSAARSFLARRVTTRFLVYGDDDFVFTKRTRFAPVTSYLDARPEVALVTGAMVDHLAGPGGQTRSLRRRYESYLYLDQARRGLIALPIDYARPRVERHDGEYFYECDIGLNWAMARSSLFENEALLWDPQFKTNGEHENFFLQLKHANVGRIAYFPGMECDHISEAGADYARLRSRNAGWELFGRKWDLEWFFYVGKSFHDFKNAPNSIVKFPSVGQDFASHLPSRHDDYLRIWADGTSVASTSGMAVLKEAKERVGATWRNAEKRIGGLMTRLDKAQSENDRLTKIVASLREQLRDSEPNRNRTEIARSGPRSNADRSTDGEGARKVPTERTLGVDDAED